MADAATAAQLAWPAALAAAAAVGSATAAMISAYSAYQQRGLAKEKLKLDLFDRRYAIYQAVDRYIAHAVREANVTDVALRELDRGLASIEFLFGDALRAYVKEVRSKGIDLMTAHKVMEPLLVGEERSRQARIIRDLNVWFGDQFGAAERAFAPYLRFPAPL